MPTQDLRKITLPKTLDKRVKRYAAKHGMSESEVIRTAMTQFEVARYPAEKPEMVSKTIYISPPEYGAFTTKARKSHTTIRHALEIALENLL
jgi:metal-responsive CopG/Arc/MetJ family transcriptional regulator